MHIYLDFKIIMRFKPAYLLALLPAVFSLAYLRAEVAFVLLPIVVDPPHLAALGVGTGAVLSAVGYFYWRLAAFVDKLESQIPQAVRIISDAVAAGLNAHEAFRSLAALALRPMSDVASHVVALVEVRGYTLEEALLTAAAALPSPAFRKFSAVVVASLRSGARMREALDAASRSFAAAVEFRRDFAAQLKPYAALFYAFMGLAVALSYVLVYLLMPQLTTAASVPAPPGVPQIVAPPIGAAEATAVMAYFLLVEAAAGGGVVGKLAYGSPWAGLFHSGIAGAASVLALLAPRLL